ncbi:MAG: ABC transporter permease [Chloroflexi bacterium]|nr:ABC transporter permease [Chloroflexota bacterium]
MARRFRAHRMAMLGLVLLLLVVVYLVIGSFAFTEAYSNDVNIRAKWLAPNAEHPMGTDGVGRDVMARTIYGGQISLAISLLSMLVTTFVGTLFGLLSGYYRGWVDSVIMRITEALMSIPLLFLLLVVSKFIGGSLPEVTVLGRSISGSVFVIILVLGFTTWMGLARLVRANVLSLKQREFVVAAVALGASDWRIIWRHILPNTLAPIIVTATLGISGVILAEAYASFLGMGVQAPSASWGNMVQAAMERMDRAWWLWFFPGLLILLTVLSVNFIGDGLRDALDPHSDK